VILALVAVLAACGEPDGCEGAACCDPEVSGHTCSIETPSPVPTRVVPTFPPVTYPPVPTVEIGTATPEPPPTFATAMSFETPSITPTLMPPDPRTLATPRPVVTPSTPEPDGYPLVVEDLQQDDGGCYFALIEGCRWEETRRRRFEEVSADVIVF
jgi:hypothetical protein